MIRGDFLHLNIIVFAISVEHRGRFVINSAVKSEVSEPRVHSLQQSLKVSKLRWLGHVFHMSTERPLHCELFFEEDG